MGSPLTQPRPPALRIAEAAKRYHFHRRYLQGLLIAGGLEGWKDEWGFWRVSIRAMEQLSQARTQRTMTQAEKDKSGKGGR